MKLNNSRFFGLEIEANPVISGDKIVSVIKKNTKRQVIKTKWMQTINNNFWHVKTDSTCGGGISSKGWEIASFKASGENDLLEICKTAKSLRKSGLKCGTDCGLHVHVDISDFTYEQASILLAYWVKIEKLVLKTVPSFRLKSKHCKSISKSIRNKNLCWNVFDFWEVYSPKNKNIHNNKDKKVTMNLVNYKNFMEQPFLYFARSTVEFRFPEGTLNEVDIRNWVILFINFIENVKNKEMPKNLRCVKNIDELIKILGIHDKNKKWFFNRIFCNNQLENKWKNQIVLV